MNADIRNINVCGVPFTMQIVEGGVLFSNKSGFWGFSARFMWVYSSHLWYLTHSESTFGSVAAAHLVRMYELLQEHIGADHAEFELKWKDQ